MKTQTIPIRVLENGGAVPLSVANNANSLGMSAEPARVIEAFSPTVDQERLENGIRITVRDYRGTSEEYLYDGVKGDKGDKPVRGVDYWTAEDRQAVTQAAIDAVLEAYPAAEGVAF